MKTESSYIHSMISGTKNQPDAAVLMKLNILHMPNELLNRSQTSHSIAFLQRLDLNDRTPDM